MDPNLASGPGDAVPRVARARTSQAESRDRPFARLLARITRPARVRIRTRNPCRFFRRRVFGWNVFFTRHPYEIECGARPRTLEYIGAHPRRHARLLRARESRMSSARGGERASNPPAGLPPRGNPALYSAPLPPKARRVSAFPKAIPQMWKGPVD